MKPCKAKEFLLCRKHIAMDLTNTSLFTNASHKCIYCKREYWINYYHKTKGKNKIVNPQQEMNNPKAKQKITYVSAEEKKEKRRNLSNISKKRNCENLSDGYVKQKISQLSSLRAAEIPTSLINVTRELMRFKRAIKKI